MRFHNMMHARLLVFNEAMAINGSADVKTDSMDVNRELTILTTNPTMVRQIRAFFEEAWKEATPTKTQKSQ